MVKKAAAAASAAVPAGRQNIEGHQGRVRFVDRDQADKAFHRAQFADIRFRTGTGRESQEGDQRRRQPLTAPVRETT